METRNRSHRGWGRGALLAIVAMLAACGGDGEESGASAAPITSAPTPTPTPTPTPPATPAATIATLFTDVARNAELLVTGKGWQFDYVANGPNSNPRDADDFLAIYEMAPGSYSITLPDVGTGTLYQFDKDYVGSGSMPVYYSAGLRDGTGNLSVNMVARRPNTGTPAFKHVTTIEWSADREMTTPNRRATYGYLGLGQATAVSDIPQTGAERLTGPVTGFMSGNAGDTIVGTVSMEIDRATGRLEGGLEILLSCFMGCSYPATAYTLSNPVYSRGSRTFSAQIDGTGLPEPGRLSGSFAGPQGKEQLIKFELPYYNPDRKIWTKAGGVILARTE